MKTIYDRTSVSDNLQVICHIHTVSHAERAQIIRLPDIVCRKVLVGVFEGMGSVWPKISGTRGCLPPTILPRKLDEQSFYML